MLIPVVVPLLICKAEVDEQPGYRPRSVTRGAYPPWLVTVLLPPPPYMYTWAAEGPATQGFFGGPHRLHVRTLPFERSGGARARLGQQSMDPLLKDRDLPDDPGRGSGDPRSGSVGPSLSSGRRTGGFQETVVEGMTSGLMTIEEMIENINSRKVKTKLCTCSCGCCCCGFLLLLFILGSLGLTTALIVILNNNYKELSNYSVDGSWDDDSYSTEKALVGFLEFGDPQVENSEIPDDFNSSAFEDTYRQYYTSTEGWENLCDTYYMEELALGNTDQEHCSTSDDDSALAGCTAGFFQPAYNEEVEPRTCPDGFFCPKNFACTIPCTQGAQCLNSTLNVDGKCYYSLVMDGVVTHSAPMQLSDYGYSEASICPGAAYQYLCAASYYCPTAIESYSCPSGHYCSLGTIIPQGCSVLADCPESSPRPNYKMDVYLLCVGAIASFLLLVYLYLSIRDHCRDRRRTARMEAKHAERNLPTHVLTPSVDLDMDRESVTSASSMGTGEVETELNRFSDAGLNNIRDKQGMTLDISFFRLGLSLRSTGQTVMNDVTGRCRPGRVTAIMGPSGAGKTTLMNTLADRASYGRPRGQLLINGQIDTIQNFSSLVGFVPQGRCGMCGRANPCLLMHDALAFEKQTTSCTAIFLSRKIYPCTLPFVCRGP